MKDYEDKIFFLNYYYFFFIQTEQCSLMKKNVQLKKKCEATVTLSYFDRHKFSLTQYQS